VDSVEAFRLNLVDVQHLHSNDAESVAAKSGKDVSGRALLNCVRLDDAESALKCLWHSHSRRVSCQLSN
jgi:hypothetical protein